MRLGRGWLLVVWLGALGLACRPSPEDPPEPPRPDAGVDPWPAVGTVLAEASGEIGATPLELVIGSARVLIPAHAARDGLRVTARLLTHVPAKYGADPVDGLVVQLLPGGQPLSQPATLVMPYADPPANARYRAMYAGESDPSWGLMGDLSGGAGSWNIPVHTFRLWAATIRFTSPPGPLFDGITSAATNTTEGGIDITVGNFTSRTGGQIYLDPFYKVYASETPGGQNFQRAWAMGRGFVRVDGLTPGRTWCLVVRAVDRDGIEDSNTAERCAVAGTPPAPGLVLTSAEPFTGPTLSRQVLTSGAIIRGTLAARGFRVDLERSADGTTWSVVDSIVPQTTELEFRDYVRTPRTFQYRLHAWYGREDMGATPARTVAVPARQSVWRTPLEWLDPWLLELPGLRLDRSGRLLLGGLLMRDPAATADLSNPWLLSEAGTPGPDLFDPGEPALFWGRVHCGLAEWRVAGAGGTGLSDAVRAADGTVYVVDSGTGVLAKLVPGGGCAEVINTRMAGSVIDLAAHPVDPLKLAAVSTHGIFVSSDGGATLVREGDGSPWANSINQRVYSPAGAVLYGPGGELHALYRNQVKTSADHVNFVDSGYLSQDGGLAYSMAMAPDGRVAIGLGLPDGLGRVDIGVPGGAFVSEPLPFPPVSLLWLPDGRLLAHQEVSVLSIDAGQTRLAVRSATGAWSQSLAGGIADLGRRVIFDPRPGHEGELYSGGLRSRDGGRSWQRVPVGEVAGYMLSGSDLVLFFSCVDLAAGDWRACRSLDGGDTATLLPYVLTAIQFNPTVPTEGVMLPFFRTTDAGATWSRMSVNSTSQSSLGWVGFAGGVWYAEGTLDWGFSSSNRGETWQQFPPGVSLAAGDGVQALVIRRSGEFVVYAGSNPTVIVPTPAVPGSKRKALVSRGFGVNTGTVYLKANDNSGFTLWKSVSGAAGPYTPRVMFGPDYELDGDPLDPTGSRISVGWYYSLTGAQ